MDSAIAAAWQSYTANSEFLAAAVDKQRAAHAANLEHFSAARQQYLKRVEESVAFVREQGLQGTTKVGDCIARWWYWVAGWAKCSRAQVWRGSGVEG